MCIKFYKNNLQNYKIQFSTGSKNRMKGRHETLSIFILSITGIVINLIILVSILRLRTKTTVTKLISLILGVNLTIFIFGIVLHLTNNLFIVYSCLIHGVIRFVLFPLDLNLILLLSVYRYNLITEKKVLIKARYILAIVGITLVNVVSFTVMYLLDLDCYMSSPPSLLTKIVVVVDVVTYLVVIVLVIGYQYKTSTVISLKAKLHVGHADQLEKIRDINSRTFKSFILISILLTVCCLPYLVILFLTVFSVNEDLLMHISFVWLYCFILLHPLALVLYNRKIQKGLKSFFK